MQARPAHPKPGSGSRTPTWEEYLRGPSCLFHSDSRTRSGARSQRMDSSAASRISRRELGASRAKMGRQGGFMVLRYDPRRAELLAILFPWSQRSGCGLRLAPRGSASQSDRRVGMGVRRHGRSVRASSREPLTPHLPREKEAVLRHRPQIINRFLHLLKAHEREVTVLEPAITPDPFSRLERKRPAEDRPVIDAGVEFAAFAAGVHCRRKLIQ